MDKRPDERIAIAVACAFLVGLLVADCRRGFADDLSHLPNRGVYGVTKEEYSEARIWLARACIAEEGWGDRAGCSAVAHAYARRAALPSRGTLRETIVTHAAALRSRSSYSKRQAFMRALPTGASNAQRADFAATLALLDRWYQGRVKDPCAPHRPVDFGSATDRPPVGAVRVYCSAGDSRFYEVRR